MTLDAQHVYDKLEALATTQATIVQKQKDGAEQNSSDHAEINAHLKRGNGDMQELRREFNEDKVARQVDQATSKAIEDTVKRGVVAIVACITLAATLVPVVFVIVSKM